MIRCQCLAPLLTGCTLGPVFLLAAVMVAACGGPPPHPPSSPHRGPLVLITFDALRWDVVGGLDGEPGLTPHLDRLIAEADWAGRGIAASSWTVPSMASLFTGLQPWEHGAIHSGQAHLSDDLTTLAEALHALGFATAGFHSNHWLTARFGYGQGFDRYRGLGRGFRASQYLRHLTGEPCFFWAHILPPHAPYRRHADLLDRLADDAPANLPERILPQDLEPYTDPEVQLPEAVRRRFWALYRLHVAFADQRLGQLLDALRASGFWDRTLLVVTADHGEEFGEMGQIGHGANLGPAVLEVPLVIKLPAASPWSLAVPEDEPVGLVRLWSTLVEAAGGVATGRAPSLWRRPAGDEPPDAVLSELYLGNGVNRFSAVADGYQLLWTSRFSDPEPEYFAARVVAVGGTPSRPPSEPPDEIFARLGEAFASADALMGRSEPELTLFRWTPAGPRRVAEPQRLRDLAGWLRKRWLEADARHRTDDAETPLLSPEDEAALRALGYTSQ